MHSETDFESDPVAPVSLVVNVAVLSWPTQVPPVPFTSCVYVNVFGLSWPTQAVPRGSVPASGSETETHSSIVVSVKLMAVDVKVAVFAARWLPSLRNCSGQLMVTVFVRLACGSPLRVQL